jgi:signal transduction histidine kinase
MTAHLTDLPRSDRPVRRRSLDRIGVRFLIAMLAVLGVAVVMIAIAAQSMFINDRDLELLMWALVPAVLGAALVAVLMARPVARDAERICDAAMRVADGDLGARTGVVRSDELGEAAAMFDTMVERLEAVERERSMMLSSISHDLRTPLAALRASVEAIRDGVAPDPDLYLSGMERQITALAALVNDLQLHSRLVSGRVIVEADGPQLARVIRNLLENAIRHTPNESTVVVAVAASAGVATLRVVDHGDGFPPEFRDRAFEPFARADPARDTRTGTAGLGLSIARGIVTAHGGTIGITDGPGGAVELSLPV